MTYHSIIKNQALHLVREALKNAAENGFDFKGQTDVEIARDMCDCDQETENFVWLGVASGEREFSDNNFKFIVDAIGSMRKEFGQ